MLVALAKQQNNQIVAQPMKIILFKKYIHDSNYKHKLNRISDFSEKQSCKKKSHGICWKCNPFIQILHIWRLSSKCSKAYSINLVFNVCISVTDKQLLKGFILILLLYLWQKLNYRIIEESDNRRVLSGHRLATTEGIFFNIFSCLWE